jgi:hypothetical protein
MIESSLAHVTPGAVPALGKANRCCELTGAADPALLDGMSSLHGLWYVPCKLLGR